MSKKITMGFIKILTIFFIISIFFCGWATIATIMQKEDLFVILVFGIMLIVSLIGSLNMIMWKLEINGDEITWRSTFGKKLFTIDSNIDNSEFIADIKRRKIPVKSYWVNKHK